MEKDKPFQITSVARTDLEWAGFVATDVSDEQMEELARRMRDVYEENSFWLDLEIVADGLKIPRCERDDAGWQ